MAIYDWPTNRLAMPRDMVSRVVDTTQRISESPLSGFVQTLAGPGAKWGWSMDYGPQDRVARRQVEGYLLRFSGREHRARIWDFKHPRPQGTCNLAGVTVSAPAAQFGTTIGLAGCGAGRTLLAGDWMQLATGQLVRVVADAQADGSGAMTVEFRHMLRAAVGSGTAVTLDKPTALFIRTEAGLDMPRQPGRAEPPFSVEWIEVFA